MSPDSSQTNGPPSSSSRNPPPSRLTTRPALSSFTSPSFPEPTPPSIKRLRSKFDGERIYEFEAPQFYDFTKQSDPERDENWFDMRKRTPSSPDFHYIARTSSSLTATRPKSASGKLYQKGNYSGSNGGLSFMNTPIGRGQTFIIPSSVGGTDIRSSASNNPRGALKKSATTENVTNYLLNSDSSDPPSTIIKSCQKAFREFGSDERKIISGFLTTPLLVIKTPGTTLKSTRKDLPRSPLQKVTKKSNLGLFLNDSEILVKETSSIDHETLLIEETSINTSNTQSSNIIIPNTSSNSIVPNTSSNVIIPNTSSNSIIPNTSFTSSSSILISIKDREHESFQASVKARILEERERIEAQAALQARKIQKLKAGPTSLPVKSTKPLTVPREFQLGCDERAQLKKNQAKSQITKPLVVPKVIKPTIAQKFTPTIPKSPLFASKLRAAAKADKDKEQDKDKEKENNKNIVDLRKKLEYRPMNKTNVSIPRSPKLLSIHRNRTLTNNNNSSNSNNAKSNNNTVTIPVRHSQT